MTTPHFSDRTLFTTVFFPFPFLPALIYTQQENKITWNFNISKYSSGLWYLFCVSWISYKVKCIKWAFSLNNFLLSLPLFSLSLWIYICMYILKWVLLIGMCFRTSSNKRNASTKRDIEIGSTKLCPHFSFFFLFAWERRESVCVFVWFAKVNRFQSILSTKHHVWFVGFVFFSFSSLYK